MKTEITRLQLKEIYDIACSTWKTKIEKFGNRNPFLNTIEFSKEEIQEMVNASDSKQIVVVKKIFDIIDKSETIKSIEDACKVLGEKDKEIIELRILYKTKEISRKTIALQELVVITKALNDGWIADFDNGDYKYILWWYLGKNFRLDFCSYYNSDSVVPTRLCHKSREIALYSAKQFIDIWRDAFNS